MNELEEILELLGEEQLEELKGELFLLLANCVASQHFQVARASPASRARPSRLLLFPVCLASSGTVRPLNVCRARFLSRVSFAVAQGGGAHPFSVEQRNALLPGLPQPPLHARAPSHDLRGPVSANKNISGYIT